MTSHYPTQPDSAATDSLNSTPRSDYDEPRIRFMCSFGGKILPRPHDDQLRYVGGDTRIVSVNRHPTFSSLHEKLSKFAGTTNISMKYQLPNEDLDALITITNDEDVENMMEEYDRLAQNHTSQSKLARLRLFLFPNDADSRTSSISSLLNGSAKREHWFFDALNGGMGPGSGLERGRSEASSIVSEVPDYLFGLDNSDEPPRGSKLKNRPVVTDNISNSDPGSPAPVVSSPFCSTSSGLGPSYMPPIPDLRPVKTKPDNPLSNFESKQNMNEHVIETREAIVLQQSEYGGSAMWHYTPGSHYSTPAVQNPPVYYLSGSVPSPKNVAVPSQTQYVERFSGQIPGGFHQPLSDMGQVYAREVRTVSQINPYEIRRVPNGGVNQQMYYEMRNAGGAPMDPRMLFPGGEEIQGTRNESNPGRAP